MTCNFVRLAGYFGKREKKKEKKKRKRERERERERGGLFSVSFDG